MLLNKKEAEKDANAKITTKKKNMKGQSNQRTLQKRTTSIVFHINRRFVQGFFSLCHIHI